MHCEALAPIGEVAEPEENAASAQRTTPVRSDAKAQTGAAGKRDESLKLVATPSAFLGVDTFRIRSEFIPISHSLALSPIPLYA